MSRFKFRVWDKAEQRYLNPKEFLMDSQGKIIFVALSISEHKQKDITIEQCTGLRDENNKLIFEGDIVLYGESENEIIWHNAWGGFARVSCAKKRLGLKLDYWELFDHESTKFEIIGNIHEMEVKNE